MSAPFAPGDLILSRRRPDLGTMIVVSCDRHHAPQYDLNHVTIDKWYVHYTHGTIDGFAPAEGLIAVPPGWQDCPEYPQSPLAVLEESTDGAISRTEYARAYAEQYDGEWHRKLAVYYRARIAWLRDHAARVDGYEDKAREQIAKLRELV